MDNQIEIGVYQHYKNREFYKVTGTRIDKTPGVDDGKLKVDYQSLKDDKPYCREINNFKGVIWINGKVPIERFKLIKNQEGIKEIPFSEKGSLLQ